MNELHDWLIAATTIARISTDAQELDKEITWLRREAHIRGECLEVAKEALGWYASLFSTDKYKALLALKQIECRLAQLEPGAEEEGG